MVHHINKLKNENHMIISIDVEKPSHEIQHPFMIKKNSAESGQSKNILTYTTHTHIYNNIRNKHI